MNGRLTFSVLACAVFGFGGCSFERHTVVKPGQNQVLRVESGDRFHFELEENRTTGYQWDFICDDSDVEVTIDHIAPANAEGLVGVGGQAKVRIRVHRGYDGPSTVRFLYRRPWEKDTAAKEFTITLFKRTGDCAFWE